MKLVFFTGAGASAPSGIPTFRGSDGLYSGSSRILEFVDAFTRHDERLRREALARYLIRAYYVSTRPPNAYHYGIPEIAKRIGAELIVITQNVDDLHEAGLMKAYGYDRQRARRDVIHVHGTIFERREFKGEPFEVRRRDRSLKAAYDEGNPIGKALKEISGKLDPEEALKIVKDPQGSLVELLKSKGIDVEGLMRFRPNVVLFGEPVYYPNINKIVGNEKEAVIVIVGTSGVVFPAAAIPYEIVERLERALIIEVGSHPVFSDLADNKRKLHRFIDFRKKGLESILEDVEKEVLDRMKKGRRDNIFGLKLYEGRFQNPSDQEIRRRGARG